MNIGLSDDDIMRLLGGRVKIVIYHDLGRYRSIEDLFGEYDCVVILYEIKRDNGHWTCLFKIPGSTNGDVEYYDPYGGLPDSEMIFMPYDWSIGHLLMKMLREYHERTGANVYYNDGDQQKLARGINTCGRHVVYRILHRYMNIDQYISFFRGKDADKVVTNFTS